MTQLRPGLSASESRTVTGDTTAASIGSGTVDVFSTPHLVALMESAAVSAVKDHLEAGWTTVGTKVCIDHLAATPPGMTVTATARLIVADGRRLFFEVEASDESGVIGRGTHERFAVELSRFMDKARGKLQKTP